MKTAMQVTIDKMNEAKENLPPFGFHDEFLRGFNKAFQMAIFIAEKKGLEAEKYQIMEAYTLGHSMHDSNDEKSAEDYYQQTYNPEQ